ncbi:hypothetical protein LZ32DRAFT_85271 [Colletotrichum eremochloae]|nr:hypothetical protein LZ32DRAFT_85271 [Colletotrichum eremochloae]
MTLPTVSRGGRHVAPLPFHVIGPVRFGAGVSLSHSLSLSVPLTTPKTDELVARQEGEGLERLFLRSRFGLPCSSSWANFFLSFFLPAVRAWPLMVRHGWEKPPPHDASHHHLLPLSHEARDNISGANVVSRHFILFRCTSDPNLEKSGCRSGPPPPP